MNPTIEAFHQEYKALIGRVTLPDEIAQAYELVDCLRETTEKSTYLIHSVRDGRRYILKIASASGKESLASEFALLSALSHPCIPNAIAFIEDGQKQYLIRDYVDGIPLDQFVSEFGPLSEADAVRLISRLCGVLQVLHSQQPPIIHRDIKPQNVLRTEQGGCTLIDFGIARRFDKAANNDTVCMGTQATAAPEQFGYMQTGPRSDVYSTGILLLFLLTGSCNLKAMSEVNNAALRSVIRRCVRFDPADRYPTMQRLQRSLQRAQQRKRYRFIAVGSILLLAMLGAAVLFFAGSPAVDKVQVPASVSTNAPSIPAESYTAPVSAVTDDAYIFSSPLIEQAVRRALHLSPDAVVSRSDLDRVTGLYICGDTIFDDWSEHSVSGTSDYLNGEQITSVGTISSLEDISHMANLSELMLLNQQITDLSPLKGLHLTKLCLGGNQIKSISVLPDCGEITVLQLHHNPLSDISSLAEIPTLASLELSQTRVSDIRPLAGLPLTYCSFIESPVADYAPLLDLPHLEWLRVSDLPDGQIVVIGKLTHLKDLTLYRCNVTSLSEIENLVDLCFLDLLGNSISDIGGIGAFSHLNGLCLQDNPIKDLTAISSLRSLEYVNLIGISEDDYSVLTQLPALHRIDCDAEQQPLIEQALNGATVEINVIQ